MEDSEVETRPPVVLWLAVGVLVVIGAFTVLGWVVSAFGAIVKLALLVVLVMAVITAIRFAANRRSS